MIKLAIIGYGNLGKACERTAACGSDFELVGVFTRRDPSSMSSPFGTKFYRQDEIFGLADEVDVACICTGSANDVTELGVWLAGNVNTVDSFDTHARMPEYFAAMDGAARKGGKLSFVGIGWDPGLFSLMRALFDGVMPSGTTHTFWGRGVSQGHSEAIRRIDGVLDAKQYTVPKSEAILLAREAGGAWLSERDKHRRECYVVAEDGADKERIAREIRDMPNYFEPYDTTVNFIGKEEFEREHQTMEHAGFVLRTGEINGTVHTLEAALKLGSNPDFTASVLMAYARANARMSASGESGARCVLDVPVSALLGGDAISRVQKYV